MNERPGGRNDAEGSVQVHVEEIPLEVGPSATSPQKAKPNCDVHKLEAVVCPFNGVDSVRMEKIAKHPQCHHWPLGRFVSIRERNGNQED